MRQPSIARYRQCVKAASLGGFARAKMLTREQRREIAIKAANTRWHGTQHADAAKVEDAIML